MELEGGTVQAAIQAVVHDQYASLAAHIFHSPNSRAVPFDSVGNLLEALDELELNQTQVKVA